MRNIAVPQRDNLDDYARAIGGRPISARTRLNNLKPTVAQAYDSYTTDIESILALHPIEVATADGDLLRENYSALRDGRELQDLAAELYRAADFRCPFCNFGQANTLEHFLRKAAFPEFSIFSRNLIAACWDCNNNKGIKPAALFIHPYFDSLPDQPTLKAELLWTPGLRLSFTVAPTTDIAPELFQKIEDHFRELELGRRLVREATLTLSEVSLNCRFYYAQGAEAQVASELGRQAEIARKSHGINHYKTALLSALAEDLTFCGGGFEAIQT